MKKEIILDGNNFSTLEEFYDEVVQKLTKDFESSFGRNLNAFNDVLWGGFLVHEYEEPIKLIWKNSEKSKKDLGTLFDTLIEIIMDHEHIELILQ